MITAERFEAIWAARGPQNEVRVSEDEDAQIRDHWRTLGGDTSWSDAFHALWRTAYPEAHGARFGGTHYATAESMRAEDPLEEGGGGEQ